MNKTEWVSVKRIVPESGRECLMFCRLIKKGWFNGAYFYDDVTQKIVYPTHWMPLPSIPKELK